MVSRLDNNNNSSLRTRYLEPVRQHSPVAQTRNAGADTYALNEAPEEEAISPQPGGRLLEGDFGSAQFATGASTTWNTVQTGAAPKLEGFDSAKLANETHNSAKYICARIFQKYPNTPEGLRQALPEIQRYFPQARIIGSKGDKIDFGDHVCPKNGDRLGVVDVIRAAGEGGLAWQWSPDGPAQGQATSNYAAHSGLLWSNLNIQDLDPSKLRDEDWSLLQELFQRLITRRNQAA